MTKDENSKISQIRPKPMLNITIDKVRPAKPNPAKMIVVNLPQRVSLLKPNE